MLVALVLISHSFVFVIQNKIVWVLRAIFVIIFSLEYTYRNESSFSLQCNALTNPLFQFL
jgi:hypothetical protein